MTQQKTQRLHKTSAQAPSKYLWHSGKLVEWEKATVHASTLGWSAISAVFEGIRAYWSSRNEELYIFQLEAHLKRLAQSMKLMRMAQTFSMAEVRQAILDVLRTNEYKEDAYVQPLVYFSERIPGYLSVLERPVDMLITTRQAPSQLMQGKGASACISSWVRLADNVMPPRAKAIANYQNSRLVSTEAEINGYDYGIILNQQGRVAEGAYACIFIIRDGVASTPPFSAGILESITRQSLINLLTSELNMPVQERDLERTELYVADEVFLCGTAMEITPLGSVDRYKVGNGRPGPVTRKLSSLMNRVVRGDTKNHNNWVTSVYNSGAR